MSLLLVWVMCLGAVADSGAAGVPTGGGGTHPPGAAFLGPFHMVVLHFPIGLFSFAALLEIVAWFRPFDGLRRTLSVTLGLGVITAILASVLGLYRSVGGDYSTEILRLHRNTGIALTVVSALTFLLHSVVRGQGDRWLWGYRGALGATMTLLLVASHHGGSLTHGQGFLTQNAPGFVRGWISQWEGKPSHSNPASGGGASGAAVARVFESKCLACHGPEKQKGKFRIDQRDSLLKGGASGVPAVVPGDPAKSGLFRMILLPSMHDDVMPPAGKEPLADAEILAVFRWIQAGAP
ncbi:MAG: hypothetical protein RLZ45_3164 [Verrucomicrobiota bacterium]